MNIAIINQKGGSGKTSLSVLIILALSSVNKRVLAVDCDPQGGLTSFLLPDIDIDNSIFDILIGGKCDPLPITRDTLIFDLIPSDHRLDKIYSTLDPYELQRKFKDITNYDFIVFDTPPTVQGISRSAGMIADRIYIPADISRATIKPTLYTLESLKDIQKTGKIILIGYREPKPESRAYTSILAKDFLKAIDGYYIGTIPKSVIMQKAIADTGQRWTPGRQEKILKPILDILGVTHG